MKPSVLRGVEEDKEVMEDASINRPPAVGFMQDFKLFCVSILCSAPSVIQEKTDPFQFQTKHSILSGLSIVHLFLGAEPTAVGNLL